jgi:PII-like signaling protein
MQVLIIVLNKIEHTEKVVEILRESGIRGATILDGLGSRNHNDNQLSTMSFLASIVDSLEKRNEVKKVIFSVIEKDSQVEEAVTKIEDYFESSELEKSAFMFTLPIQYMRGGELERHIKRRDEKMLRKD